MGKLTYLVIHTTDTPFNREVTPDDITLWHLGALKNSNGTYTFKSKQYSKSQLDSMLLTLPSGKTVKVLNTNGRGWSTTGYADMIQRTGKLVNLNPYNFDNQIDPWEVTNGVANKNSISRNVVLAGGWTDTNPVIKDGHKNGKYLKITDLYTNQQIQTLVDYCKMQLEQVPELKIVGHNELASKTCPNFSVPEFLKEYGLV